MSAPKDQKQAEAEQTKEFSPSQGKGEGDEVIEISDVDEVGEASQMEDVVVISDVDDTVGVGKVGKSSDVEEVGKVETSDIGKFSEVGKESEVGEVIKGDVGEISKIAEREEVGEVSGCWANKTTTNKGEKISPSFFGNFRLQKDETKCLFTNLAEEFKEVEENEWSAEITSLASNAPKADKSDDMCEQSQERDSAAVASLTEWSWDAEDFFKYVEKPKPETNDDNNA